MVSLAPLFGIRPVEKCSKRPEWPYLRPFNTPRRPAQGKTLRIVPRPLINALTPWHSRRCYFVVSKMSLRPRNLDHLDADPSRDVGGRDEFEVRLVRQQAHLDLVTGVSSPPDNDGGHILKVGLEDRRVEQDPAHPVHVHRDIVDPDEPLAVLGLQILDLELHERWCISVDVLLRHLPCVVWHCAYSPRGAATSMR